MTASNSINKIILFQGDSITDGNRGRNDDPNHILGHSYAYLLKEQKQLIGYGMEYIQQLPGMILLLNNG